MPAGICTNPCSSETGSFSRRKEAGCRNQTAPLPCLCASLCLARPSLSQAAMCRTGPKRILRGSRSTQRGLILHGTSYQRLRSSSLFADTSERCQQDRGLSKPPPWLASCCTCVLTAPSSRDTGLAGLEPTPSPLDVLCLPRQSPSEIPEAGMAVDEWEREGQFSPSCEVTKSFYLIFSLTLTEASIWEEVVQGALPGFRETLQDRGGP